MKLDKLERNVRHEQETSEKRMEMNWVSMAATGKDHSETMQDNARYVPTLATKRRQSERRVTQLASPRR